MIEGIGLKKSYRMGRQILEVLRGVNIRVQPGELTAIVGPSGSGKSTLLHLLGGLDRPSHGEVRFNGKNLYALGDREVSQIRNRAFGFVFQFYHLIPELTAWENVALPGWIGRAGPPWKRRRAGRSVREIKEGARELLRKVGLGDRLDHLPSELSGGEQQRVALARALMNDPQVVFCDEPTGNLDSETGQEILELLLRINRERGAALVIVTHEPAVTRVAKRIYSLRDGQLWPHHLLS